MPLDKIASLFEEKKEVKKIKQKLLDDYALICYAREIGLLIRKETLGGRAKFGISGDGKELAQIALSKWFKKGDIRSGYYRDHSLLLSLKGIQGTEIFAQLYAHNDLDREPSSGGRQMVSHFATRLLDQQGNWVNMLDKKLCISDISPTAGHTPRILGLGLASKFYRNRKDTASFAGKFSNQGNEVVFGTLGDASTSQGAFLEFINAAAVIQIPVVMSIWDDGYGISVPKQHQTTKSSISAALAGFKSESEKKGWEIFQVKGWDYLSLLETYKKATDIARNKHTPVLVHVTEMTQPTGHSTSGDHRTYKSKEQLCWEEEFDCLKKFETWLLEIKTGTENLFEKHELDEIKNENQSKAKNELKIAFQNYQKDLLSLREKFSLIFKKHFSNSTNTLSNPNRKEIETIFTTLKKSTTPLKPQTYQA